MDRGEGQKTLDYGGVVGREALHNRPPLSFVVCPMSYRPLSFVEGPLS